MQSCQRAAASLYQNGPITELSPFLGRNPCSMYCSVCSSLKACAVAAVSVGVGEEELEAVAAAARAGRLDEALGRRRPRRLDVAVVVVG